jgi:hypothetical protein
MFDISAKVKKNFLVELKIHVARFLIKPLALIWMVVSCEILLEQPQFGGFCKTILKY